MGPKKITAIKFNMPSYQIISRSASVAFAVGLLILSFSLAGCAGGAANVAPPTPTPGQANPQFGHVFIVVEENFGYADVIGSSSMPYFNSLANKYGLATNYYANLHPSIPNYFEMTAGKTLTIDDSQTPQSFPVSDDNVVRELLAAGKTWKSYAEDLPSAGYIGGDTGNYLVRHNPLAYMKDVQNTSAQGQNLVPFSEFAADLPTANLPQYSFIVPNRCNDAHDCPLSTADTWLKNNIDPLINSPVFQKDGLLIIVFDEASTLDFTQGGGHVAAVVISPFSKPAYKCSIELKLDDYDGYYSTVRSAFEVQYIILPEYTLGRCLVGRQFPFFLSHTNLE